MSTQDSGFMQQPQHHFEKTSSDLDIAEQLVQHSQPRQNGGPGTENIVLERTPPPELAVTTSFIMEDHTREEGAAYEHGQDSGLSPSQERQSDTHYAPINNPPASGQVCR